MSAATTKDLNLLRNDWLRIWPEALALWSRFVQLHEPTWCLTKAEEEAQSSRAALP